MSKSKSFLLLLLFVLSVSLYAESCRLLIVCHESFTEDIEDFVKWKHDIGWAPYVLEIDATTGRSSSSIKSEINSCIGSMDEIPEYILIIGGDELMRMGYLNSATSDSYYGDLDSDNRTEIPVGRFPGTYESEIRSLVAKTMSYAQDPEVDGDYSWLKKASLLRGGSDSHYTSFMNTLNGILEEYDYEVSLHTTSDAGVLSEINEGLGYIIFRGSGVEGWGGFYITPTDLRNGSNTPIVSGTTCATIRSYGPSWVNVGSEANPKGGVIYIGSNTVSSGHDLMMQRSAMAEGFYQGFLHGMTTGQATENGRQYVLHYGGIACDREYSSLNMMGDPTIWVWTDIPHEISVEHFPFYVMGDEEFGIEVTFEDEPVESALCCISIEDDLYVWGYTDLDGYVNMEYSYIGEGTDSLLISVVGFNIKPYYSKVACRVDGPRPYVTNSWIDDTETGNGDTLLSRNEICEVKAIIRNIGSTDCGEITAILTSESPFITITDSIIEISSLASDTEILPTDNFQFQVNENAPVDERIAYAITLYSDDAEYISNSNTPFVVGANIVFSEPIIVDITPWGNNNSVLD